MPLWHTLPLHYLPYLEATRQLFSAERIAREQRPLRSRSTSAPRARRLGLAGYVHLSFVSQTPLLADKRAKGYPHALLEFSETVLELPGVALGKYNSKAWRHRDDFAPVTDTQQKASLITSFREGRYPSLEVLVPDALSLSPYGTALHLVSEKEAILMRELPFTHLPILVSPDLFPAGLEPDLTPYVPYFDLCRLTGTAFPPPDLPFD